jgi:hypothetical protein
MNRLQSKTCLLNDKDVEVYFLKHEREQGDYCSPTFSEYTAIIIVEKNGVEIGTTEQEDELLIEQL